jgi:hypothetical protein
MMTESCSKVAQEFCCGICDYTTSKKSSYEKHLSTDKHKMMTNDDKMMTESCSKVAQNKEINYKCNNVCDDCGKKYKYRQGLSTHKKNCKKQQDVPHDNMMMNLILEIVKSNSEFKNIIVDQNSKIVEQNNILLDVCKNGINNNSNNNVNSNNKAFNLQFFLNETCKDAMNISEFVDSLTLQLSDLENVGKLGFVEGMSNIIIENMKLLDISKRPIHCMDTKREVMYLKDQNTWEKSSDDDNKKIRRVIKQIATKNVRNLRLFKEKHPDCINYNSKYSDQYLKLQTESCGGKHPDYENESKIIKRLAKVMVVDKSL